MNEWHDAPVLPRASVVLETSPRCWRTSCVNIMETVAADFILQKELEPRMDTDSHG